MTNISMEQSGSGTAETAVHDDSLIRHARALKANWLYIAAKTLTAWVLLDYAQTPYIPFALAFLVLQDMAVTYARMQLKFERLAYKPVYLALAFTSVASWTGIAVAMNK